MRIDLIFIDAGGGHRAAADALQTVFAQQRPNWQVRQVNLQDLLDSIDPMKKITGIRGQDIYNLMLRKGWTAGSATMLKMMHAMIRILTPPGTKMLRDFWSKDAPDMVLSLIPNFNIALREGLRQAAPTVPYATLITDLADYPPNFWIEKQDQYMICGTPRARQQALELGYPAERVFLTSGMVLHPRFYEAIPMDRNFERTKLGLDPSRVTGLVLFGGYGSTKMLDIAKRLDASPSAGKMQMILICGKNQKLAEKLKHLRFRMPVFVEGFTKEVPRYMRLSDFFIGKPGPGSISEALAMGLPVIVERNALTLPQERYNADWVIETQTGMVVRNFKQIAKVAAKLLEPETFSRYRKNAAALNNRAVFEVAEILERIMNQGNPQVGMPAPLA